MRDLVVLYALGVLFVAGCTSPESAAPPETAKAAYAANADTWGTERENAVPFETPSGLLSKTLPQCEPRVYTSDEPYESGTGTQRIYSIRVCDPPRRSSPARSTFGKILRSTRLAEGSMWLQLEDRERWVIIHYRLPDTPEEMAFLDAKGVKALEQKTYVSDAELPLLISLLPPKLRREHILFFFAYHDDSYEIFLLDNDMDIAKLIARTLRDAMKNYRRAH